MKILVILTLLIAGFAVFFQNKATVLERKLTLERGDEVEIVAMNKTEIEANLFADCKISYIAGVALYDQNVVFLTLRNCSHPFFKGKDYFDVRPRETIRKKIAL